LLIFIVCPEEEENIPSKLSTQETNYCFIVCKGLKGQEITIKKLYENLAGLTFAKNKF
jgi:hypothetical protein